MTSSDVAARRCAVLGSPIAHSLSPVLHRAAYGALGLDWSYDAFDVAEPELAGFLTRLTPDWRGLSLTMPLKEAALGLCRRVEEPALSTRSVNTVIVEGDGSLTGTNTDVGGLVAAWRGAGIDAVARAAVVGAGATARSACAALARLGVGRISVLLRDPARAHSLRGMLSTMGVDCDVMTFAEADRLGDLDLVVATVPPGDDPWRHRLAGLLADRSAAVCDVVYRPARTPFVAAAERAGALVVDGFELLLQQAAMQVQLMTGVASAPISDMRAAGRAALGESS